MRAWVWDDRGSSRTHASIGLATPGHREPTRASVRMTPGHREPTRASSWMTPGHPEGTRASVWHACGHPEPHVRLGVSAVTPDRWAGRSEFGGSRRLFHGLSDGAFDDEPSLHGPYFVVEMRGALRHRQRGPDRDRLFGSIPVSCSSATATATSCARSKSRGSPPEWYSIPPTTSPA
jgi:hypothetical protein